MYRKLGIGKALFHFCCKTAKAKNCARFEWAVLRWNEQALKFYEKSGAKPLNDWISYRMDEKEIKEFLKKR